MSDEFTNSKCAPSDCATCGLNCGGADPEECAILTVFPIDEQEYIALLPLDENGQNQSGEVYLYRFSSTENGDPMLANIEDDAEYQAAATAFDIVLDNARRAEEGETLE